MTKYNSVLKRFLKGAISGGLTAMSLVTLSEPSMWSDFIGILNMLAMAGLFGALNGLLLALNKWASWKE